jgi:hypothetical protein
MLLCHNFFPFLMTFHCYTYSISFFQLPFCIPSSDFPSGAMPSLNIFIPFLSHLSPPFFRRQAKPMGPLFEAYFDVHFCLFFRTHAKPYFLLVVPIFHVDFLHFFGGHSAPQSLLSCSDLFYDSIPHICSQSKPINSSCEVYSSHSVQVIFLLSN